VPSYPNDLAALGTATLHEYAAMDASGTKTVLYAFTGGADGLGPDDRLVADPAGKLYGTTVWGGQKPYGGTVYKVAPTGKETVLYNFPGGRMGAFLTDWRLTRRGISTGLLILQSQQSRRNGTLTCALLWKAPPLERRLAAGMSSSGRKLHCGS
jgi:uncharacterized repeat protein (TIGR03803 family)